MVALSDTIGWGRVSAPATDAERLVFRQLFPTLVRLDCRGEIRPALASTWTRDSSGRVWTFNIPGDRRLADGSMATAPAIASIWRAERSALQQLGIDSVAGVDATTLRVGLGKIRDSAPGIFADPALSVVPASHAGTESATRLLLPQEASRPAIDFRFTGADPRDALDHGADLVVTGDPAIAGYVAGRSEFVTVPLPWSRTYVLLQHAGSEPLSGIVGVDSVRRSLAKDVVPAEARPSEGPFWWSGPGSCRLDLLMEVNIPTASRIVYPRADGVAKALAERIVALSGDTRLRAVGLGAADFGAALRNGGERAYIVYLPREVAAPCHQSAELEAGGWYEPLIDTRARAIVRRGSPPLSVDRDGTIRIVGGDDRPRGSP